MIKNLVSIIIPCFNVEDFIEESIASCLQQTYNSIEIICVDNASTDSTYSKLKKLAAKHSSIKVLTEKNSGAPFARNKGLAEASGEWLQFLDADDILLNEKIKHQVFVAKHSVANGQKLAAVIGDYKRKYINGSIKNFFFEENPFMGILNSNFGHTSSILWNANHVFAAGGWDNTKSSSQEYNLLFELFKLGCAFKNDHEILTLVRNRPSGQITSGNQTKKWTNYANLRCEMLAYAIDNPRGIQIEKVKKTVFEDILKASKYDFKEASKLFETYLPDYNPYFDNPKKFIFKISQLFLGFSGFLRLKKLEV